MHDKRPAGLAPGKRGGSGPDGRAPEGAARAILDRRREIVEHPFGSIKQWMNQGAFLMRGLGNVRGEFSLTALAYNLRRVLNILGVGAMIAAIRA